MNDKHIEERNDLFDSAIREQLAGYEPKVPHALWNHISSELDMGEASDESTAIGEHHEKTTFRKWRLAIAAAVILTLGVGTLLYTLNTGNETISTPAAIANKVSTTTVSQPSASVATETKMVALSAPITKKAVQVIAVPVSNEKAEPTITAKTSEPAPVENVPAKQDQAVQEMPLEFAAVQTENKPVEVGSIPLASLTRLSTPTTLNDEITVIKSTEKKRKHARKNDEESTKIIMLGKKFDTQPDIRYQIPVRF